MPSIYRVQCALHRTTGLPEDDVINTFHFRTNEVDPTPAVASALNGHVAAAYNTVQAPGASTPASNLGRSISRSVLPTLKAYNARAEGSPLATDTMAGLTLQSADIELPGEVALCLSFRADLTNVPEEAEDDDDGDAGPDDLDDRPERPASRRRGRIYFGPLHESALDAATVFPMRPDLAIRNVLLGMAKFLANPTNPTLTAVGTTWGIFSKEASPDAFYEVTWAWVDNEWDTQRRRGVAATVRTQLDLP